MIYISDVAEQIHFNPKYEVHKHIVLVSKPSGVVLVSKPNQVSFGV